MSGDAPFRLSARRTSNRALTITLLVSLGLHGAALVAVLLLAPPAGETLVDAPMKQAEVELVMEEHAGDAHPPVAPAASRAEEAPLAKAPETPTAAPPAPAPRAPMAPAPAPPAPAPMDATAEPAEAAEVPPAAPPVQTSPAQPEAHPDPKPDMHPIEQARTEPDPSPPSPESPPPTVTLSGTDSPSNALAWGERILPAAPDAVFHNRPPKYPRQAGENGQHGTVVVLIHISPAGTAASADVVRSSGYVLLDQAAREAVLRWRFLPAVKGGQPVESEMTMGFVFDYE